MKLALFKSINSEVLNVLKSAVPLEYSKLLATVKTAPAVVKSKGYTLFTKVLGSHVQNDQKSVIALQDELFIERGFRTEIALQLAEVRKESNELRHEIFKVKRQDDFQQYMNLMRVEIDLLRKEQELSTSFPLFVYC